MYFLQGCYYMAMGKQWVSEAGDSGLLFRPTVCSLCGSRRSLQLSALSSSDNSFFRGWENSSSWTCLVLCALIILHHLLVCIITCISVTLLHGMKRILSCSCFCGWIFMKGQALRPRNSSLPEASTSTCVYLELTQLNLLAQLLALPDLGLVLGPTTAGHRTCGLFYCLKSLCSWGIPSSSTVGPCLSVESPAWRFKYFVQMQLVGGTEECTV